MRNVKIISDKNTKSLNIKKKILKLYKSKSIEIPNLVIVIGGDGFMLQTLKKNKMKPYLFYGINSGNYGFLMNKFSKNKIFSNLKKSKVISISPLEMSVKKNNSVKKFLAINEISVLRQSRQVATLSIKNNSKILIKKLISDCFSINTSREYCIQFFSKWTNIRLKFKKNIHRTYQCI